MFIISTYMLNEDGAPCILMLPLQYFHFACDIRTCASEKNIKFFSVKNVSKDIPELNSKVQKWKRCKSI